jgi:Holliday junction DNA helicase RuvA
MIGFLQGAVRGECVVVHGVGYTVQTPDVLTEGEQVELYVTTAVRENDISLYGFRDRADQEMFRLLQSVQGVGPAVALSVLRHLGTSEVVAAIESGDAARLKGARGFGPKAQQATLLALRGKLTSLVLNAAVDSDVPVVTELVETLTDLGWPAEKARETAIEVAREYPDADEPTQLRRALNLLRAAA